VTGKHETAYEQLKDRLATISDLGSARSLLFWDQQTYTSRGAVAGRVEQVATLSRLSHEMLVNEATARLLSSVVVVCCQRMSRQRLSPENSLSSSFRNSSGGGKSENALQ